MSKIFSKQRDLQSNPESCSNTSRQAKASRSREDAWMEFVETAILSLVIWLDPTAVGAVIILKLCFHLLKVLRHHHRPTPKP